MLDLLSVTYNLIQFTEEPASEELTVKESLSYDVESNHQTKLNGGYVPEIDAEKTTLVPIKLEIPQLQSLRALHHTPDSLYNEPSDLYQLTVTVLFAKREYFSLSSTLSVITLLTSSSFDV